MRNEFPITWFKNQHNVRLSLLLPEFSVYHPQKPTNYSKDEWLGLNDVTFWYFLKH